MKEMIAFLRSNMYHSRADRLACAVLLLFVLVLVSAFRLNDVWAEQPQPFSREDISRSNHRFL